MYGKRTIKPLILSALILSGFASLVYQVIWQRVLTQVIGIDAVAISIIVAAFMAGLGVGGGLAGKIIHIVRRPLLWLALLEILIGTFGVISVGLIRAINQMGGFSSIWAQVALNIVLLEPAIIMMGTTSPLMVEAWARHVKEKEAVGTAYGANILGAAVGILIGGFLLIGIFGLQKSTYIVALLDIAAGAAFFFADWRMAAKAPQRSESLGYKNQATVVPPTGLLPALSAFLIGFSAIGYEIIFFRLLQTYYGVTPYVFPTVLFAYLINMSLGVYFIPKIKAASRRFHIFSISACAIVLSVPVIFFQKFLLSIDYGQLLFVFDPTLTSPDAMLIQIVRALLLSASLMLPVVFISGLFPLIVEHDMNSRDQSAGVSFGHIYLFQTLGNTLGALVTGLILFDHMGVVGALMLMGVLLLAASCLIIGTTEHLSFRAIDPISLSIGLIVVFLFGSYDYFQSVKYYMTKDLQISPKHVYDTLHGLTFIYDISGEKVDVDYAAMAGGRFWITGFPGSSATGVDKPAARTESLVYAVNPGIKNILYIGIGAGTELISFNKLFPQALKTVVEINPDLISAMKDYGHPEIVSALDKAELHIMDGRRFLLNYPDRRFDYIHIGVDRATTTGAGNLFSREFIKLARERLSSKGIISLYGYPPVLSGAIHDFTDVYVFSAVSGITVALLSADENRPISKAMATKEFEERFKKAVHILNGAEKSVFANAGPFSALLGKGWYADKEAVSKIVAHLNVASDDLLVTEYYANQESEIRPQSFRLNRAVDLRDWGTLTEAAPFPFPAILHGGLVYHSLFKEDQAAFSRGRIAHSGGNKDFSILSIDSNRLEVYYGRFFSMSDKTSWQWNFHFPALARPFKKKNGYLFTLDGQKSGRGLWGVKLYCVLENGSIVLDSEQSNSNKRIQIQAFIYVPTPATECGAALTMDEMPGFGSRGELIIYSVELKQVSVAATPAD